MKFTDVLAAYGAVLSTGVFIWNAQRARPKVRVVLTLAVEKDDKGAYQSGVGISVQNPSAHAVHITNISFLYPWSRVTVLERAKHVIKYRTAPSRMGWCHTALSNYQVSDGCPVSIEPGKSHYVFVERTVLERILEEATHRLLIAVVQDALWRNKYSRPFKVNFRKKVTQRVAAKAVKHEPPV